jgi:hypothetical protein
VVYRIRAAWCFEVLGNSAGAAHARAFCRTQGKCSDCAYYKRIVDPVTDVLVISADRELRARLETEACDSVAVHFAQDGYEASTAVATIRPAFVVIDGRATSGVDQTIVERVLNDSRVPGLRVVLYGSFSARSQSARPRTFTLTQTTLRLRDIAGLIASMPVEVKPITADGLAEPPNQ